MAAVHLPAIKVVFMIRVFFLNTTFKKAQVLHCGFATVTVLYGKYYWSNKRDVMTCSHQVQQNCDVESIQSLIVSSKWCSASALRPEASFCSVDSFVLKKALSYCLNLHITYCLEGSLPWDFLLNIHFVSNLKIKIKLGFSSLSYFLVPH